MAGPPTGEEDHMVGSMLHTTAGDIPVSNSRDEVIQTLLRQPDAEVPLRGRQWCEFDLAMLMQRHPDSTLGLTPAWIISDKIVAVKRDEVIAVADLEISGQ